MMMDPMMLFVKLDHQTVIGELKATGSRDADVLHAKRTSLQSPARMQKFAGATALVMGAVMTITIIGAVVGIPFLFIGWWMRRRGSRNVKTVERAFAEFTGSTASVAAGPALTHR